MPLAFAEAGVAVEDVEVEGWVTDVWGLLFTGLVPAPHEHEPPEEGGAAFISAHLWLVSRCHSSKLTRSNAAAFYVQQWSQLNFGFTCNCVFYHIFTFLRSKK